MPPRHHFHLANSNLDVYTKIEITAVVGVGSVYLKPWTSLTILPILYLFYFDDSGVVEGGRQ